MHFQIAVTRLGNFVCSIRTLLVLVSMAFCVALALNTQVRAGDEEFPSELVDFVPYQFNPVFEADGGDTWDRVIRERGTILREGDTYHMWYTGYSERSTRSTRHLGYATSPDGLKWTRYPGNPIFDDSWVEDMCVIKHEGTYYMFAEDESLNKQNECFHRPHLLTSTDRIHWHDHGELDMRQSSDKPLKRGLYGTPTVWIEGNVWHLLYELLDTGIWLAKSADGKVWTNVQDDPVMLPGPDFYDKKLIAVNQLIKHAGRYYIYYHGFGETDGNWTTNVAMSTNLLQWKKFSGNPLLPVESNKSSGMLVHDGAQFRLYTMHSQVHVHFPREQSGK